jgi:hypothetical protein
MAMSALGASPLAQRLETSMIAFLEQGCRFRKPVLLGDTVHAEFEVAGFERKGGKSVLRLRMLRQIPLRRRGDVPHEVLLLDGAVSRRFDGWVGPNVAWAAVAKPPHRWRPHPSTPLMRQRALPRDLLSANRRMTESRENRTAFTHGKELTRASRFIEGNMNDLRRWWPRPWVLSR